MTKLSIENYINLINILKENKDDIIYSKDSLDKKRHELIETYKDTPEILMKLLHETNKPYKSYKDIKEILKGKGFDCKVKDTVIKTILENVEL